MLEVMADTGEEPAFGRYYCLSNSLSRIRVLQRSQVIPPYSHIREYVSLLSSARTGAVVYCVYSVNDWRVPYMTAYVDLEDPFLNHRTHGLTV